VVAVLAGGSEERRRVAAAAGLGQTVRRQFLRVPSPNECKAAGFRVPFGRLISAFQRPTLTAMLVSSGPNFLRSSADPNASTIHAHMLCKCELNSRQGNSR